MEFPREDLPAPIDLWKRFPQGYDVFFRKDEQTRALTISPAESEAIEFHSRPAHHETVMAHLLRLAAHRHLKGDDSQKSFLLTDYTRRIAEHKATELQVFDAVEHFIENDTGEFFPAFAKLSKEIFGKVHREDA